MEDSQILALYWLKHPDAIPETDKKYGRYCFSIANRILQSREDSEECVNDTWMNVWNAIPPQKPRRFPIFLAKITRNLAFDRYRAKNADKRGSGEIAMVLDELAGCVSDGTDVSRAVELKELEAAIGMFVRSLPEREATIFARRYFFAESVAEIASRFHISQNNISVSLSRTRKKLRQHLVKEGYLNE